MTAVDRARLRPVDCPDLIRLGPQADGGYVVPAAEVEAASLLLSLGVKQDWSFERAFVARNPGARVLGVDPGVGPGLFARQILESAAGLLGAAFSRRRRDRRRHAAVLARSVDYFRFFRGRRRLLRRRVAAARTAPLDVTLPELLDGAGGAGQSGVFLKIDIEGAEYDVVPDVVACAERIGCLVVEFHGIGRRAARFATAIDGLLTRFRIVHAHANNYGGYAHAVGLPDVLELTLVNASRLPGHPEPSPHAYPRAGLDWPNAPARPDLPLDFA